MTTEFMTRERIAHDLLELGVGAGDTVMVHAALSRVGKLLNGPDAVIGAVLDAVGAEGTLMAYADWDARYDELADPDGAVPEQWRDHIPPFDPLRSRACRDYGVLAEFVRTTPGARRSLNPGASMVALGARAEWLTADHPLDFGYGPGSPLAKLVQAGGKVLMLGAPRGTMTLLHHAEHLADLADKTVLRYEVPIREGDGVVWHWVTEFDTSEPVAPAVQGLPRDHFEMIVDDYVHAGRARLGLVGEAESVLVDAADVVAFGVDWMERLAGAGRLS